MITISNIKDNDSPIMENTVHFWVERTSKSPLGNPFRLKDPDNDEERNQVIEKYEQWFNYQLAHKNEKVCHKLKEMLEVLLDGSNIDLMCWCAPKRCHAEIIKNHLEKRLEQIKRSK
jgi:hypothetical protein